MNDDYSHWYLILVDIEEKQTFLLDPLPNPKRNHIRRTNANRVVRYLLFSMVKGYMSTITKFGTLNSKVVL